jgi:hypothetical protein
VEDTAAKRVELSVPEAPKLSVVIALWQSAGQAENVLFSLSSQFQKNVRAEDYEVIVVEARSSDMLGEARALAQAENVRYFSLEAADFWRAEALNFGVEQCRAAFVGLLLDGAHVLTPRVIELALAARAFGSRPLVVVPAYCLGRKAKAATDDTASSRTGLEGIDWRSNSHELFAKSRFGPANPNGFLGPLLGASCSFFPAASYREAGGADARVDRPGGGALSLGLYTKLSSLPGTQLIVLAGEGAFRQHHPEIDDPGQREIEASLEALLVDRALPLGDDFRAVHREPIVLGTIPGPAQRFVVESADVAHYHCVACEKRGEPSWYEDRQH